MDDVFFGERLPDFAESFFVESIVGGDDGVAVDTVVFGDLADDVRVAVAVFDTFFGVDFFLFLLVDTFVRIIMRISCFHRARSSNNDRLK